MSHHTGPPGGTIASIADAALPPFPPGATKRTPILVGSVLRSGIPPASPITQVLLAYMNPTAVAGSYTVTIWDPTTGGPFTGAGSDVVHIDIASYFSL